MIVTARPDTTIRGPSVMPPPDRLADREGDPPHRAVLADRGDPGMEHRAGVDGRPDEQQVVALGGQVVAARPVADADEVCMPVDESGQDRRVAVLVRGRCRAVGRPDLGTTADGPDRPALDQDGRILEPAGARPVEQAVGGEERPVGWSGHVRTSVVISATVTLR